MKRIFLLAAICFAFTAISTAQVKPSQMSPTTVTAFKTALGINSIINVKDYGALGNDSHDDGSAIQAAFTAASVTGGTVYIPKGIYRFSTTLNFNTLQKGVVVRGSGSSEVALIGTVLKFTGTGYAINMDGSAGYIENNQLSDLCIIGNANCTDLIYINRANDIRLSNLQLRSCTRAAIEYVSSTLCNFDQIKARYLAGDTRMQFGLYSTNNTTTNINNIDVSGTSVKGVALYNCQNFIFNTGTAQSNNGIGLYINGNTKYCTFLGMDIEHNKAAIINYGGSNGFHDMTVAGKFRIATGATNNRVLGGIFDTLNISVGTQYNVLENLSFGGATTMLSDSSLQTITFGVRNATTGNLISQTNTAKGYFELKTNAVTNKIDLVHLAYGNATTPGGDNAIKFSASTSGKWYASSRVLMQNELSSNGGSWLKLQTHNRDWTDTEASMINALVADPDGNIATAGAINYALDNSVGSTDTYTATLKDFVFTVGKVITFHPLTANTTACTLTINAGSAKGIKTQANADPATNDMVATGYYSLCWNGSNWVLMTK